MYERFTDRARKVMLLAHGEAQRLQHNDVGSEHILLAIAKEGSGVGANVLKNLDVDLRTIGREVEKPVPSGTDVGPMGKLALSPHAKKVLEYSLEEARNLGHNYVGSEHLLLGLLRDEGGVAAQILTQLGLRLSEVRNEVLAILGEPHKEESPGYAPEPTAQERKVDLGSWLVTVATWDGLLPASVILVPTILVLLLPRDCCPILGGAQGLAVCIAILLRMSAGSRQIAAHQCGRTFRRMQFAFLSVGILVLAMLDLLLMLIGLGAMQNRKDYVVSAIIAAVLGSIYLTSMTFAMYPGRMNLNSTSSGTLTGSRASPGYARFTHLARQVMQLANQEAQRLHHEYIGTEHILRGLATLDEGVAAIVLRNLGVEPQAITTEVDKFILTGDAADHITDQPHTPRAKKVIEYAMRESRELNDDYVGTEHILLGLLREEEGFAAQVLMNLGLRMERVRAEIRAIPRRSNYEGNHS